MLRVGKQVTPTLPNLTAFVGPTPPPGPLSQPCSGLPAPSAGQAGRSSAAISAPSLTSGHTHLSLGVACCLPPAWPPKYVSSSQESQLALSYPQTHLCSLSTCAPMDPFTVCMYTHTHKHGVMGLSFQILPVTSQHVENSWLGEPGWEKIMPTTPSQPQGGFMPWPGWHFHPLSVLSGYLLSSSAWLPITEAKSPSPPAQVLCLCPSPSPAWLALLSSPYPLLGSCPLRVLAHRVENNYHK